MKIAAFMFQMVHGKPTRHAVLISFPTHKIVSPKKQACSELVHQQIAV